MKEILLYCDGYTSNRLMEALTPVVGEHAKLELRPRTPRVRSPTVDPTVLAGIIQAGATMLAAVLIALIDWRRHSDQSRRDREHDARLSDRPIRIVGADGVSIEVPLDVDERTLRNVVEQVRQTEVPRIYLR